MPKVLIIEDRRENIVFIANNILKPRGYEIITARDGQIGLTKAQEETPDLIITDLKLPKMGGLEVMEALLEQGIFIPTIVMTFHGTEETAMKALRLKAQDYLIKPFTIEEMEAALERASNAVQYARPETGTQEVEAEAKIAALEEEVEQLKFQLAQKGTTLNQKQPKSSQKAKQKELDKMAERIAAWEEDNARLTELLAESKDALSKAESQALALEEAMLAQKGQTSKYQKEAKRLASELRSLSEAIRLMSQDMEHQMGRLAVLTPEDKE